MWKGGKLLSEKSFSAKWRKQMWRIRMLYQLPTRMLQSVICYERSCKPSLSSRHGKARFAVRWLENSGSVWVVLLFRSATRKPGVFVFDNLWRLGKRRTAIANVVEYFCILNFCTEKGSYFLFVYRVLSATTCHALLQKADDTHVYYWNCTLQW